MKPLFRGKAISTTYFCACVSMGECVSVCACSLTNPACNARPYCHLRRLVPQYFSTLCHKRYDFRNKKVTERKMYVLIFSTTFV